MGAPTATALLVSSQDVASVTLRDALLRCWDFEPPTKHDGLSTRRRAVAVGGEGGAGSATILLAEMDAMHLDADGIEESIGALAGVRVSRLLVLSKHRSESGKPALTVHAVGNWGPEALYGGRPRTISPHAGRLASAILREMAKRRPADFVVTFEATHHGPATAVPTAYVELGSGPREWVDRAAADCVVASVVAALEAEAVTGPTSPVLFGLGGGHYGPRFTDIANNGHAAFGHILPSYAIGSADLSAVRAACAGHDGYLFDARGAPARSTELVDAVRELIPEFDERGRPAKR
ncbi:MAG: D-aminoacyl-tRNA deacylase [Thermoplasmatota archaeon]